MAQDKKAIARPYAEAVLARAKETDTFDQWSDMLVMLTSVTQSPDILDLVANPKIPHDQANAALLDIVRDHCTEEGQNLLRILAENHRLFIVPEIANLYEQLKRESQGVLKVQVRSAYPLNTEQMGMLASALKKKLHRDIEISFEEDSELIGGVLIHAGDLVIDGSVRGQLNRLANQLRL